MAAKALDYKLADLPQEEDELPTPRDAPGLKDLSTKFPPPRLVKGPSGQIFHSTSIMCLRPAAFPRNMFIYLVEHPFFEPFIALVITFNCIELTMASPLGV